MSNQKVDLQLAKLLGKSPDMKLQEWCDQVGLTPDPLALITEEILRSDVFNSHIDPVGFDNEEPK